MILTEQTMIKSFHQMLGELRTLKCLFLLGSVISYNIESSLGGKETGCSNDQIAEAIMGEEIERDRISPHFG